MEVKKQRGHGDCGGCEIEARGISYKIRKSRFTFKKLAVGVVGGRNVKENDVENGDDDDDVLHVLKDVSFKANPWEVSAIVGPSGAGKSTLLEILAGNLLIPTSTPALFVDQKPINVNRFRKISGYVTQKDVLFPLLTVRETLLFTAKLRLGLRGRDVAVRVDALIGELGLAEVGDARIGDDRVRGISGGERRRVSIGVDVVHDPRVLILDEPTSGLDSAAALQIVHMLKKMAENRGRTVIISIHQPGFRILNLFDSVALMAVGSILHQGSLDELHAHVKSVGHEIPLHVNFVEFAMDSISTLQIHSNDHRQDKPKWPVIKITNRCTLQDLFWGGSKVVDEECFDKPHPHPPPHHHHGGRQYSGNGYANSWPKETVILTHRYLKNVFRTKELFACRTIQMLVSGLVLGSVFYNVDETVTGAMEIVGLFAFILTYLLSSTTEALPVFLQERQLIMKETSAGSYRLSSYVLANSLVFLPFLLILALFFTLPIYFLVGLTRNLPSFLFFLLVIWLLLYTANSLVVCVSAVAPDFIVGNSIINAVMGGFFLFSGYFIKKDSIPNYWIFMHYISLFKYPFEALLDNEFGCDERCVEYSGEICAVRGVDLLRRVGIGSGEECSIRIWTHVGVMLGFIFAYRLVSYVLLRCKCRCAQLGGLTRVLT